MKKKLIVLVLAGLLLGGCGSKIPTLSNGDEAMVEFSDGSKISVNDIWNDIKDNYALTTVINKIDEKILEDKYKDKVSEAEEYAKSMEASIKANYTDENGKFDEASLTSALQNYGYGTLENYTNQQKLSYLKDIATKDYVKENLSSSEIKKYYKDEIVGDINCNHILVKVSENDNESEKQAKAQSIIDAIKADIKSGTKAEDAFKKYQDDDSVTYQELGFFNKGDMVSEFEKAAFDLKVGSYTKEPVKTSYGYHIILKLEEKDKEKLDDIKDKVKDKLADKKIEDDKTLKTSAMIELRKEKGVNIVDTDVNSKYDKYMNQLLNQ